MKDLYSFYWVSICINLIQFLQSLIAFNTFNYDVWCELLFGHCYFYTSIQFKFDHILEYGQSVLSKTSLFWTNLHNKDAIKFALKGEIIACWQIINVIIKFTSLSYELRRRRAIVLPHSIQPKIVGVILNEIMIRYKIYLMAYIMCEIYQVCQIVGDHTINPYNVFGFVIYWYVFY